MAIAMEFDCRNGGHVIIRDDCCTGLTPEELDRRRARISRAIWAINDRLLEQQEGAHERAKEGGAAGGAQAPAE